MARDWMIETLQAIADFKKRTGGTSPTVRELRRAMGISSTSVVAYRINRLVEVGLLEPIEGDGRSRAFRLKGEAYVAPPIDDKYIDRYYREPPREPGLVDIIEAALAANPGEYTVHDIAERFEIGPEWSRKIMKEIMERGNIRVAHKFRYKSPWIYKVEGERW